MTALTLKRIASNDFATYGQLFDANEKELTVTLELPWRDNRPLVSCIPAGTYTAVRYHSPKHRYDLFMVTGVPDRSAVEIHIGNEPDDTEGCILVGSAFGPVNDKPGIVRSRVAFERLMLRLHGIDAFSLTISDPS